MSARLPLGMVLATADVRPSRAVLGLAREADLRARAFDGEATRARLEGRVTVAEAFAGRARSERARALDLLGLRRDEG